MIRRMVTSSALLLLVASPAAGQEYMTAEAAREFVAGRLFSYSCFDGTLGAGRINNDGSVTGTLRVFGKGPYRYLRLPQDTLFVRGNRICARLNGLPFDPCFILTRNDDAGFRGAVSGLSFMYCDFKRIERTRVARKRSARKPSSRSLAGASPTVP